MRNSALLWSLGAVALLGSAASFLVWRIWFLSRMPRPVAELYIDVPSSDPIALSPQGSSLAYVSLRGDDYWIHLRSLENGRVRRLVSTEEATTLFFSPDGRELGFVSSGKLRRLDLATGESSAIAEVGPVSGGTFVEEGSVLLGSGAGFFQLNPGAVLQRLGTYPVRSVAASREWIFIERGDESEVEVVSLSGGAPRPLLRDATLPRYVAASGHLLFLRGSSLWASGFDPETARLRGNPSLVLPDVEWYDMARNGTLAYRPSNGSRPRVRIVLHWDEELERRTRGK